MRVELELEVNVDVEKISCTGWEWNSSLHGLFLDTVTTYQDVSLSDSRRCSSLLMDVVSTMASLPRFCRH